MFGSYRRLFARPGVMGMTGLSLSVKLGPPTLSLALLLVVFDDTGSYAVAGLTLTGHALALALCAPIGGRLVDRFSPRKVLPPYLLVHAAAYTLVLLSIHLPVPAPLVVAAAAMLGATSPPAGAVIRGAWPRLVAPGSLNTAYALDNAINELMFIAGPVLVAGLLLVMPASAIIIVTGTVFLAAVAAVTMSRVVRTAAPGAPTGDGPSRGRLTRLVGPLAHRPTLILLFIAALGTFTFGSLRVAMVASATVLGSAGAAGIFAGLLSAGTLAAGLVYGGRHWSTTGRRLLGILFAADCVLLFAGVFDVGYLWLAVVITAIGAVSGPRDTLIPVILTEHAPATARTEVFAWLNTFMWIGYGLGTAVAGQLTGPRDSGAAAFVTAGIVAAGGILVSALLPRAKTAPDPAERSGEGGDVLVEHAESPGRR